MNTPVSLLERLQQPGASSDWDRFIDLYTPVLLAWARRLCSSDADAADLVQEVFVILVEKLPGFRYAPDRSFRAWLKTIILNKHRENLRRRHPAQAADGSLETLAEKIEPFWEAEYRQYLMRRALEVMQTEFEPATWQAFWQLVVEGRSGAEVAAQLGLSVNAVYISRSRVLRRLRLEMEGLIE